MEKLEFGQVIQSTKYDDAYGQVVGFSNDTHVQIKHPSRGFIWLLIRETEPLTLPTF